MDEEIFKYHSIWPIRIIWRAGGHLLSTSLNLVYTISQTTNDTCQICSLRHENFSRKVLRTVKTRTEKF